MSEVLAGEWRADGDVAVLGGRTLLFSPSRQAVFILNETAALVWEGIQRGLPAGTIATLLSGSAGVDRNLACCYISGVVAELESLGVIYPRPQRPAADAGVLEGAAAGVSFRISGQTDALEIIRPVFRCLEQAVEDPQATFEVLSVSQRYHLFLDGAWIQCCAADELATAMKGQVLKQVLRQGHYDVALHAACLVRNGEALLITGSRGAGKTTLSLRLLGAGFRLAADDVTLLDGHGRVTGLPFAPAVKAGAWPLLARSNPDLNEMPVQRRPDKHRVRYAAVEAAPCVPYSVRQIVSIKRQPGAPASLEPCDPVSCLKFLILEAHAAHRRLTVSAFKGLIRVLNKAKCHVLAYSNLDDVVTCVLRQW